MCMIMRLSPLSLYSNIKKKFCQSLKSSKAGIDSIDAALKVMKIDLVSLNFVIPYN